MTLSGGISAHGVELRHSDSSTTGSYTILIAEVHDIEGPSFKLNTVDSTHHESAGWSEEIGTIMSGGDVTFECGFITTGSHGYDAGLVKWMTDKTVENFLLIFPDTAATHWYFTALVKEFKPKFPVKGMQAADVVMGVVGAPTLD